MQSKVENRKSKILIANRGEIACRVIRTVRRLGLGSVAIYSEADAHALHVRMADEAVCVGPPPVGESYLDADRILEVARQKGVTAIHPGYGFLSENADFAEACEAAGIRFIGPTADQIRQFGLKHVAREIAEREGVPLPPGSGLVETVEEARAEAERIKYPVMLKSTGGGGGIGLQLCRAGAELEQLFDTTMRLGRANFKHAGVFLEKFIERARHIEVQIFGDGKRVVALGERDCSVQRRNQKVVEETPAPKISDDVRSGLHGAAVQLGEAIGYESAGTVEFIYDARTEEYYFLEVNTRLQVEHGVTEEVFGVDLVEWMIKHALGELDLDEASSLLASGPQGHAIEVRVYAEDPNRNFQPSTGLLTKVEFPEGTRVDSWIETGTAVEPYYDPLLAKVIVHEPSREAAIAKLALVLSETSIYGLETNLEYLKAIAVDPHFRDGDVWTALTREILFLPRTIDVTQPGTQTTVQDYPGREGYWWVGVPPSGPMDSLSFRLANRLVGNPVDRAALEITMMGPTLAFNTDAIVALSGATIDASVRDRIVKMNEPFVVRGGETLRLGRVSGAGARSYLAIAGGFDVPEYLGSRSTFTLGGFGGHGGRALRTGDVLRVGRPDTEEAPQNDPLPPGVVPHLTNAWEIGVLYGPHGAPDFFTPADIEMFFATEWKVHFNSSRTGVRLVGPKPEWARPDGGEAGLHPSNIHDNAYAIGAIDFTGDMPIILGPDGPSLGGFVCPAVVANAELWKLGQLKADDTVRFKRLTVDEASAAESRLEKVIEDLLPPEAAVAAAIQTAVKSGGSLDEAVIAELPEEGARPRVVYRGAGDRYLLIEYGPIVLDLNLRFRVHALQNWFREREIEGVVDLTPGIRSLQIHFDSRRVSLDQLLAMAERAESDLPPVESMHVPTRIVHLPLSWEDESTLLAIEKYTQSVRPDAPWCPSNIEFIRRINGLESIDEVKRIVFDASYLVMGLGDVYLGAPVAVPVDPRHRLVTTKYNPARTWTPENAVGIGGAYLCIYGMEGPGGYQFVGRTIQVWNRFRSTPMFPPGKPWLLQFFDQIRFYPVSHEELMQAREDFLHGRFEIRVEEETFHLGEYQEFLREIAPETRVFEKRRQEAFHAERERWAAAGLEISSAPEESEPEQEEVELPPGGIFIDAPVSGNVWKIVTRPGDRVSQDETLAILESMKTEIPITSPQDGVVDHLLVEEGKPVSAGQHVAVLRD